LKKCAKETLRAVRFAYGDTASKKSAVYEWYHRFKNGQETLEDEPRSGRPSTSRKDENVAKVKTLVRNDRRMTIVQIAAEVGLSVGSVHTILKEDLGMRRVCAKFVPRLLSVDQMECRKTIAGDLFEQSTQDPSFLGKVVTG
jgi:hypothetical protein